MEAIDWIHISGIIVDIILFFIIAGNAVLGYRRGLVRVIFSLCSSIIALILVFILYKPVTNFIINKTNVSQKLENVIEKNVKYLFEKNGVESDNVEDLKENDNMYKILGVFIGEELGDQIQETKNSVINYVSTEISHKIVKTLTFFILFAVIRLLLYVFRSYMEMLASIPIVRIFNGTGGMLYGIIRGFFLIYAVFAILTIIMPIISETIIITSIQNAPIGSKMFNNNIILNWIF